MIVVQEDLPDYRQQRTQIFHLVNESMKINKYTAEKVMEQDIEINLKSEILNSCFKTEQFLINIQNRYFNDKQ